MANNNQVTTDQQRLTRVIDSLEKVPRETKQMVFDMAQSMTELEIIRSFNQQALDMFNLMIVITKRMNKEKDCNVAGYKALFDNAIKINAKLPLDKFTLLILEFAADIYAENENCFLDMAIPDAKVTVGNEFGLIRSQMFKNLWKELNQSDKNSLKEVIIPLTTFAHAHLYKTVLLKSQ
ncbi:hypothetical protein QJ856_gp0583 [Tupanvirus deep ocean]|uniref:Uncharacterized protein n=2 Tax=Tupanvirus TaxID=2094720 RepID=A0AC62A965_9VIRU|nr:hypothetical protein QJ856_gp0583 [Tupanvirus deep ocean]QKU34163.1 hypothetical protein [Tupanvirus deep ocean]